jgi:hypothetical protein
MGKLADTRTGGRLEAVIGKKRAESIGAQAKPFANRFEALSGIKGGSKTAEHQANSSIFRTLGQGMRSPMRLGFKMADKATNALKSKQSDAKSMRYLLNTERLKQALKTIGNRNKHGKYIGATSYKVQEDK